jgi:hypothetical protein
MRSAGEDYFGVKTLQIVQPQTRMVHIDANFDFGSKTAAVDFRFTRPISRATIVPENIHVQINNGRKMAIEAEETGRAGIDFALPSDRRRQVLLLEVLHDKYLYRKYISVPAPDHDFDITFHPEGGPMLQGVSNRIAFKALKAGGASADVSGMVFNSDGDTICAFRSEHLGMGSFLLTPAPGKSYYTEATVGNSTPKRFELPAVQAAGYALEATWVKGKLFVSVRQPTEQGEQVPLYLVAHTRGIVQYVAEWEYSRPHVFIPTELLPSGISQLLLLDAQLRPLSERLVFVRNDDQTHAVIRMDKTNYDARSPVEGRVTIADVDGGPLQGSFSVAVTDNKDVQVDTTANILTSLLLTSELRGHIENPAYYFRKSTASAWMLDLLMLTQGWRRYDVTRILKGQPEHPTAALEAGPEISGTVKTLMGGDPVAGAEVNIMGMQMPYFEKTTTDVYGRFYFHKGEQPDSTAYVISATPKKGAKRNELFVDSVTFPDRTLTPPMAHESNRSKLAKYADLMEQKYTYENGIRMIYLSEVTISPKRRESVRRNPYYWSVDRTLTQDRIDDIAAPDIWTLLRNLPGVTIIGENEVWVRRAQPTFIYDHVFVEPDYLDMIDVFNIAQIDLVFNVFGSRGEHGTIVIYTKGPTTSKPHPVFHIKNITPLGYQKLAEFYAPKYDTPASKRNTVPDLRTTIHWQPNVQTDSAGTATFSFYTADASTTYTVMMEGLTDDGKVIHAECQISRIDTVGN